MRLWKIIESSVACTLCVSCSTSGSALEPPLQQPDSAADEPSRSSDAGADATSPDGGPLSPLDVTCSDPAECYLRVSGNGGGHVCGLLKDGSVQCWGRDTLETSRATHGGKTVVFDGALGRGAAVTEVEGAAPAKVVGLSNVTQVSVGPNLGTCARTGEGAVYCWGRNEFGQLGRPPSDARLTTPTRIDGLPAIDHVELGYAVGCAITSLDRALYCWGRWIEGLGIPKSSETETFAPQIITTFSPPIKALVIGTSFAGIRQSETPDTIITLQDGDVLANVGQTSLKGESEFKERWPRIRGDVRQIGAFAYSTTGDYRFRRWFPEKEETLFLPSLPPFVDVKIGPINTLSRPSNPPGGGLTTDGRLFRWGHNLAGALGRSPAELLTVFYPVEVMQVKGKVVSFATTVASTCASLVDGKATCWGSNQYGELGRGTVDPDAHPAPEPVR